MGKDDVNWVWMGAAGLLGAIFVIDLIIPDPLPFIDEIVLGLGTVLMSRKAIK